MGRRTLRQSGCSREAAHHQDHQCRGQKTAAAQAGRHRWHRTLFPLTKLLRLLSDSSLYGSSLPNPNSAAAGTMLYCRTVQPSAIDRRDFCISLSVAALSASLPVWAHSASDRKTAAYQLVAHTDRTRILKAARDYVTLPIRTITAYPSERSPGGPHDYFSQADYFWPNPKNPSGPYINRDGQSNPANFNGHRKAMIALSIQMPALTAAWLLTGDARYGRHACAHLRAWFITPDTRMNPNLEFSQGVHGVSTGRSWGIIDTLHLVEVARAAGIVAPVLLSAEEND